MLNVRMTTGRLVVFLSGLIFLVSCAQTPADKRKEGNTDDHVVAEKDLMAVEKSLIEAQENNKHLGFIVPERVSQALISGNIGNSSSASVLNETRFDVSVEKMPARAFFVSLVADSGVNIVTHPEVDGFISLDLTNVSVPEVLEITRDVYGYEYKLNKGIYTIYPRKLSTQVFPINYPDIKRVGVTDTSVLIGKITSDSANSSGNNSSDSGSSEDGANLLGYADETSSSGSGDLTPGARVQTLNVTDFWTGLHETLMAIVGDGDGRLVMTNPQSGLVVVKALTPELTAVREFLDKSELSVKRQVVLETKILEVQLNDEFQQGINWSAIGGELAHSFAKGSVIFDPSVSGTDVNQLLPGVTLPLDGITGYAKQKNSLTNSLFTSAIQVTDITKLISLLDRQGNVQVLSSPRIATVNNQKAVIRVGSDEFFVTGVTNSTTSNAASTTSAPSIELASFFSGISLDVTPQISESGEVILHVHPLVSRVVDQVKDITVGDDDFSLPLALRDVRESDSIVRAKNGQVVVLGGLMQENMSLVNTDRGFLGKIPVVNLLFKHKAKTKVKTELVILMRPVVVDDDEWDTELANRSKAMNAIADDFRDRTR